MSQPETVSVFRPGLLDGQVVLITGGGTGIGFGISELLASLGARVVIASRKSTHLNAAVEALSSRGFLAEGIALDVRNADQVREAVAEIDRRYGRLDVLVNNAAGNFYAASADMSPNAWKSVVEIDLYGSFYCSQAVYPVMARQGGGRIISTSMTLHYRGWPQMAHATAAKAGIDALTRTLAVEWAPQRIRVNAIAPGPIPTEGVRKAFTPPADGKVHDLFAEAEEKMAEFAKTKIPLGRWGSPRDIANMVAFLASDAGDWITGSIFVVDGGEWLAR